MQLKKFFNFTCEDGEYYKKYHFQILGIRFKIGRQNLSNKKIKSLNSKYEEDNISDIPNVISLQETLYELINTDKSISRYGDGEFDLIFGKDLPFQTYSEDLALRLKEILHSNNSNLIVAIPDIFNSLEKYTEYDKFFWRKYIVYNRDRINRLLDFNKKYYDTEVSRPYMGIKDKSGCKKYFEDFKKVYADKDIIFVEGEASRLGYKNDLFSGARSIKRIICPAKNAFDKYDEILETCKKFASENTLFIIALGPTATVLAFDLANAGYRALDLGHIDVEYEWYLMGAKKKVPIKNKYVNEVKHGRKITVIEDENYLNEIIANLA